MSDIKFPKEIVALATLQAVTIAPEYRDEALARLARMLRPGSKWRLPSAIAGAAIMIAAVGVTGYVRYRPEAVWERANCPAGTRLVIAADVVPGRDPVEHWRCLDAGQSTGRHACFRRGQPFECGFCKATFELDEKYVGDFFEELQEPTTDWSDRCGAFARRTCQEQCDLARSARPAPAKAAGRCSWFAQSHAYESVFGKGETKMCELTSQSPPPVDGGAVREKRLPVCEFDQATKDPWPGRCANGGTPKRNDSPGLKELYARRFDVSGCTRVVVYSCD